jgi:hypothetical protein
LCTRRLQSRCTNLAASSRSCCFTGHRPIVFRCFRHRCFGHGSRRGVVDRRHGSGGPNLRLQRLLWGRIIWLQTARDIAGQLASDKKNPDPAFRQRLLCGLTILQGLRPAGLDHWNSGSLYNPDDGVTYRVSAELRSADVFVALIYLGVALFGETKTLLRVPRLRSEGWC